MTTAEGNAGRQHVRIGADGGTSDPPPRWARRVAVLTALMPVPSALWRCSMALGLPVGVDPEYRRQYYAFPGWGTVHVLWISVLLVGLGLLTFGLVQRWGEVVPEWIPAVGSKPVPRTAAIIPAATGALALTLLWLSVFSSISEIFDEFGVEDGARAVVIACYAPMLLWGPLLGVLTVSYARRTRSPRHSGDP